MMRFLYIGSRDVLSRHELGFIASLSELGEVDVVVLGSRTRIEKLFVASDNGRHIVNLYEVPCNDALLFSKHYARIVSAIADSRDYSTVFATPRVPVLVAHQLKVSKTVVLRLWSVRAAKLRDNLRFGAYEDIPLFMPSIIANMYYILRSINTIAIDHATYVFATRVYQLVKDRIAKVYPPYGYIPNKGEEGWEVPEIIDKGSYILGFTVLSKTGPYLKFEAKPHAIALYLLAKKTGIDVVLAGSSYDDWRRVFPNIEPPRNLHIIGRGFPDSIIAKIYKNARLVLAPITNRSISNRLLETLFYGKPIVTSEVARLIHPELENKKHLFVSSWDTVVDDTTELLKDEDLLKSLEQGAREAYNRYFSTRHNMAFLKELLLT
uniref:Glycosyltransferase family 1 protein n=1 Tax=Ignisphaera aggregans TaxID=334771 RepID=A0A7J2U351_9CREN